MRYINSRFTFLLTYLLTQLAGETMWPMLIKEVARSALCRPIKIYDALMTYEDRKVGPVLGVVYFSLYVRIGICLQITNLRLAVTISWLTNTDKELMILWTLRAINPTQLLVSELLKHYVAYKIVEISKHIDKKHHKFLLNVRSIQLFTKSRLDTFSLNQTLVWLQSSASQNCWRMLYFIRPTLCCNWCLISSIAYIKYIIPDAARLGRSLGFLMGYMCINIK